MISGPMPSPRATVIGTFCDIDIPRLRSKVFRVDIEKV
jgi:hypothetical protein